MRLYFLCLILISTLFSKTHAVLNDFITPSMVSFSKPNDIVKAYSLYPGFNPTTRESQITNPPYKNAAENLYYFTYSDFLMQIVYSLTSNDEYGANSLAFMLESLQNNANLRGKQANSVMLQHLPAIYKTSDSSTTKYDQMITDFDNLYGITNLLKMQCNSVISYFTNSRSSLPLNIPTASKYNAAYTAYSNVITSLNQLLTMTDSALSSINSIKSEIVLMKDVATSLAGSVIDDITYNDLQFTHAQNIKLESHSLYSTLYYFSKESVSQI